MTQRREYQRPGLDCMAGRVVIMMMQMMLHQHRPSMCPVGGDVASHHSSQAAVGELDRPVDLTGHVLSPFFVRNMDYMDCRFHSIAHLMCYRYAIANGQNTFATGIRMWTKHLVDFPTPKFVTGSTMQQWREILINIYLQPPLYDGRVF